MFFQERILRILLILNELSSPYFLNVTFLYYSNRDLGSLTAKNLSTLGHLIGSISLTSPYSALKEDKLSYIPERIAVERSQLAEGLIYYSTTKHILIRFFNSSEQSSEIQSYNPSITFLKRVGKSRPLKGIFKQHIQQRRTPSDQISHLLPYFFPFQIQGLVQQGVPVCVSHNPCQATLDTFKSPSLAIPFTKNILALFISLWIILLV